MLDKGLCCLIITKVILIILGIIVYIGYRSRHSTIKQDTHRQRNKNVKLYGELPRLNLTGEDSDPCTLADQFITDYDFDYIKTGEYRDATSTIDYFRLTLLWAPAYCEGRGRSDEFECTGSFNFIVHGLWPTSFKRNSSSSPRSCRNEDKIPLDLIKKYFCIMPSEKLMQSEWEKHGTCY
jgi:ribonuclease T2